MLKLKSVMEIGFQKLGIDKDKFYQALRTMGKDGLKTKAQKEQWSADNPTRHYCYMVVEFIYNYILNKNAKLFCLKIDGEIATHHFIKLDDGTIIDLTAEQFEEADKIDYDKAVGSRLITTPYGVSLKTQRFAELMGYNN